MAQVLIPSSLESCLALALNPPLQPQPQVAPPSHAQATPSLAEPAGGAAPPGAHRVSWKIIMATVAVGTGSNAYARPANQQRQLFGVYGCSALLGAGRLTSPNHHADPQLPEGTTGYGRESSPRRRDYRLRGCRAMLAGERKERAEGGEVYILSTRSSHVPFNKYRRLDFGMSAKSGGRAGGRDG